MNQQLTENEIDKMIENLNYSNQTDVMARRLFFDQTETIRRQRMDNERIVEVLKKIAADNPSESTRKEAIKTLAYLGITPPAIRNWRRIILIGLLVGIFLVLVLVTQSYFSWPIDILIGRLIMWIPIFGLAAWLLAGLWGLTSKIQRKHIRLTSKITLGLIIAITAIWLMGVFFLTCLGIGAAGCY